jgi:hypothetical protein
MAPIVNSDKEPPLADYFFITGIESTQIFDGLPQKPQTNGSGVTSPVNATTVETTIEENEVLETADASPRPNTSDGQANGDSTAAKRRSRMSNEARKSISSLLTSDSKTTSNRSSAATIKGTGGMIEGTTLNEVDFDNALRKFAAERETFLEEIHFSAGTLPPLTKPKKSKSKAHVIKGSEDLGGIKSGVGSIRRRISTMNSLKRQPSLMRQCKCITKTEVWDSMEITID